MDLKQLKQAFNRTAKSYEHTAILPREIAASLCERLHFIRISPNAILDIGAGTGLLSLELQQRYPEAQIIALDFAIQRLQMANKSLALLCGDAHALPLKNQSIDLLISNLCLTWCHPIDAVLQEWQRVLKPGGILLFTTFGTDTLRELTAAWKAVDTLPHVQTFLDMHDIGDSLLRSGWQDPVLDVEHYTLTYSDLKQLLTEIKAQGMSNFHPQRRKTLTGKKRLQVLQQHYESYRRDGVLPAHVEITFGHAMAPSKQQPIKGEFAIPLAHLRRPGVKTFAPE